MARTLGPAPRALPRPPLRGRPGTPGLAHHPGPRARGERNLSRSRATTRHRLHLRSLDSCAEITIGVLIVFSAHLFASRTAAQISAFAAPAPAARSAPATARSVTRPQPPARPRSPPGWPQRRPGAAARAWCDALHSAIVPQRPARPSRFSAPCSPRVPQGWGAMASV